MDDTQKDIRETQVICAICGQQSLYTFCFAPIFSRACLNLNLMKSGKPVGIEKSRTEPLCCPPSAARRASSTFRRMQPASVALPVDAGRRTALCLSLPATKHADGPLVRTGEAQPSTKRVGYAASSIETPTLIPEVPMFKKGERPIDGEPFEAGLADGGIRPYTMFRISSFKLRVLTFCFTLF